MFASSRNFQEKVAVCAVFLVVQAPCLLNAQNFTTQIANANPFGVNGPLPFGQSLGSLTDTGLKGGFTSGLGLQSNYNSNFFQSENNPEDEVTISLTPILSYTTDMDGGARSAFNANYSPVANSYLNNSDLNGFDQSGSVSLVFSGSRTTISLFAGYTQTSGTDRFAGEFVNGSALSLGARVSYQLAPRTSVFASLTPSLVEYSNSSAVGFDGYSASLGGSWAATELFSLGPALSYSTNSSDISGKIETWGISLQGNYSASERVQIAGSIGTEYYQGSREPGSGNFNMTGSLNATYIINEIWSWSNFVQSGLTPSPTQTNYTINNWSLGSSLNRQLLRGSLGFGFGLDFSSFEQVGAVANSQEPEQNFTASLNYSRPIFGDRLGFNSSLLYTFNNGQSNWSQIQLSAGLNLAF